MARVCNLVNFPELLFNLRKAKGYSQVQVAKKLNITNKSISAYENGAIKPSVDIFLKLLNIYGYRLDLVEDNCKSAKDLTIPLS